MLEEGKIITNRKPKATTPKPKVGYLGTKPKTKMSKKPPTDSIENIKIEDGVLIEYNGKYWGTVYSDGKSHTNGWVDIDKAELHDGRFLIKPEDATFKGSHETKELQKGRVIKVKRITTIKHEFLNQYKDE